MPLAAVVVLVFFTLGEVELLQGEFEEAGKALAEGGEAAAAAAAVAAGGVGAARRGTERS